MSYYLRKLAYLANIYMLEADAYTARKGGNYALAADYVMRKLDWKHKLVILEMNRMAL